MNKIDYENYVAFPFTVNYITKKYSPKVIDTYGDQLCFLFQNGFDLDGNTSFESIQEQMWLFNNFETYDDFEDLKGTISKITESVPLVGYKIIDSVFNIVLKKTAWATKKIIDIKTLGDLYRDDMVKCLDTLKLILDSKDLEVKAAANIIFTYEVHSSINDCYDAANSNMNNVLIVKYQRLYKEVLLMHWDITKKFMSSNDKGLLSRMGNINDELYGSTGCFNPNNNEIRISIGSAVSDLARLNNDKISSEELVGRMLLIAKECKDNGEKDPLILAFLRGDRENLDEVRYELVDICFNGIMVLVSMKHGLSLDKFDTLNSKRAEKIMHEVNAICDYTHYYFSEED